MGKDIGILMADNVASVHHHFMEKYLNVWLPAPLCG